MAKSEMSDHFLKTVLGTNFLTSGPVGAALAIKGNLGNFCLCNPESWVPQIIGIWNPSSTDKDPESITWIPEFK